VDKGANNKWKTFDQCYVQIKVQKILLAQKLFPTEKLVIISILWYVEAAKQNIGRQY